MSHQTKQVLSIVFWCAWLTVVVEVGTFKLLEWWFGPASPHCVVKQCDTIQQSCTTTTADKNI